MKKFLKVMIVLLIIMTIGLMIANNSSAWNMALNAFEDKDAGTAGEKVTDVMGAIINIVSTIGAGIAIIMLIVIGIKYVSASPEGKADAKKDLPGYVIGAVILFGISGILKLLQMFIDANLNDVGSTGGTSGTGSTNSVP